MSLCKNPTSAEVAKLGSKLWSKTESEAARKYDHSLAQQLNLVSFLQQFDFQLTPTRAALPGFELKLARHLLKPSKLQGQSVPSQSLDPL